MNFIKCVKTVYNRSYDRRPILTLCITNGILGAISDQLAQTITYIDYHRNIDKMHREHPHSEILDNRLPDQLRRHEDLWPPPPSFDPFRTVRFALYNFCVAPIVGKWYMVLDRFFPMPAAAASSRVKDIVAIKRMCTDQVLFAPASLAVFFTTMGYAETRKWEGVLEKFRDAYAPAVIANYKVWPLVQLINFKIMPIQYRLPFVSSLGILWNAYLSWINNASKQEESIQEKMHLD